MKVIEEKEIENKELGKEIENDSLLKNLIVEYVGRQLNPEDNKITLEMILEVFAKEFPEFLLPLAEENFIKGYERAFEDLDKMANEINIKGIKDDKNSTTILTPENSEGK